MPNPASRPPEHLDEIVASIPHVDLVVDELQRYVERGVLKTPPARVDPHDGLGLARIPLEFVRDEVAEQALGRAGARDLGVTEILAGIRESCQARYRGWAPIVGKNRVLSGISGEGGFISGGGGFISGGGGFISGGGGGAPRVADQPPLEPVQGDGGRWARLVVVDARVYQPESLPSNVRYDGEPLPAQEPMPFEAGHARFVLGLVEREAPGAQLELRGVLDEHAVADAWSVACAIADYAASDDRRDVDILNLSLGCYTVDNEPPLLLRRAVDLLPARTLVVAAAGNHRQPNYPRPFWPAAFDDVTAVGARDPRDGLADFSPRAPWVDVTAPGVDIVSDYLDGEVEIEPKVGDTAVVTEKFPGYATWRGTSFASATVAGAVAAAMTEAGTARAALAAVLADQDSPVERYRFP